MRDGLEANPADIASRYGCRESCDELYRCDGVFNGYLLCEEFGVVHEFKREGGSRNLGGVRFEPLNFCDFRDG